MNKEERLVYDIDTISDNIRKKYHALQHGIRESDETFRKNYRPILEPLEAISRKLSGDMMEEEEEEEQQIKQEEPKQHVITENESGTQSHNASHFSEEGASNPNSSHFSEDSLANKSVSYTHLDVYKRQVVTCYEQIPTTLCQ